MRVVLLAAVSVALVQGCNNSDDAVCSFAPSAQQGQGIAGQAVAVSADDSEPVSPVCSLSSARLLVVAARDGAPTNSGEADTLLAEELDRTRIDVDELYFADEPTGAYLVCFQSLGDLLCTAPVVEEGRTSTVNISVGPQGSEIDGFSADGDTLPTFAVPRGTVTF